MHRAILLANGNPSHSVCRMSIVGQDGGTVAAVSASKMAYAGMLQPDGAMAAEYLTRGISSR
jgi:hypothetical protein